MSDIPKCPNCEAAEKRAIAVVVCVSALGPEFLDECSDPDWQQAMEIVKKLKGERNAMAELLKEIRDHLDDDPEDDASDWHHIMARRIDAALGRASNSTNQQPIAAPSLLDGVNEGGAR